MPGEFDLELSDLTKRFKKHLRWGSSNWHLAEANRSAFIYWSSVRSQHGGISQFPDSQFRSDCTISVLLNLGFSQS